jgi:predicted CXXCH cytochrome family protein
MQIRYLFFILAFILITCPDAFSDENIIKVNYPPDKTIREFTDAGISISVPLDIVDKIHVRAENDVEGDIIPDSKYECFSAPLILGVNVIEITAFRGDKELEKKTISIFRRSDIESSYRKAPPGFQKDRFHLNNNRDCAACHELRPKETDKKPVNLATFSDMAPEAKAENISSVSTCYSCHKKITSYPFVHGPASVWSCLSCHDPDSVPRYNIPETEAVICFTCHTEQDAEWHSKKYIHGPVNIGKCAICHSPHSSNYPHNLVKPVWDLCTSCHRDKKSGKHVLGGMFFKEGHPTKGRPDPLRKGKELSCASCHNPHASDYPKLWALNAKGAFDLCLKCHRYYYK